MLGSALLGSAVPYCLVRLRSTGCETIFNHPLRCAWQGFHVMLVLLLAFCPAVLAWDGGPQSGHPHKPCLSCSDTAAACCRYVLRLCMLESREEKAHHLVQVRIIADG